MLTERAAWRRYVDERIAFFGRRCSIAKRCSRVQQRFLCWEVCTLFGLQTYLSRVMSSTRRCQDVDRHSPRLIAIVNSLTGVDCRYERHSTGPSWKVDQVCNVVSRGSNSKRMPRVEHAILVQRSPGRSVCPSGPVPFAVTSLGVTFKT